ncbi:hypothetical protein [Arthrobacter sp. Soil761]|uniref:hypothetical protein n=1 Tax=Arthrobacter sp. Soil761 TaxID=1736400 RepID=UPI0006FAF067|nr:hypothetical protein [Arthrobacter sp. Soil761]KRE76663.1 hypothetical protein ASG79_17710 [Arthrobacter sp. Soil761]
MLTNLLPDPFLWISHHQWGDLLSGILGAIFSGLIAVWVLKRTLKTQRRQFSAQIMAQSEGLEAQLEAQRNALEKQLDAQADGIMQQAEQQAAQASKERELAARAQLIDSVHAFQASIGDVRRLVETCAPITNGLEKWRFELQAEEDQALWQELGYWRSVLNGLAVRRYPSGEQIMLPAAGYETLLNSAAAQLLHALIEFRRNFDGKNWNAHETARVLRNFREVSLTAPASTLVTP